MPSKMTYLKVVNNTPEHITTQISNVDNYDWGSGDRPDHNFHNRVIGPNQELVQPECINKCASANLYTMDLVFDDGTRIVCRVDQGKAGGGGGHWLKGYIPAGLRIYTDLAVDFVNDQVANTQHGILTRTGGDNNKYSLTLSVKDHTVVVEVHPPRGN